MPKMPRHRIPHQNPQGGRREGAGDGVPAHERRCPHDGVDILMYPRKYRSDANKIVYYYCASAPKRTHVKEFLKNFWKLVGRK